MVPVGMFVTYQQNLSVQSGIESEPTYLYIILDMAPVLAKI